MVYSKGLRLALVLAVAVVPTSSMAQKSPEKIKLTAESKDGAVLIRVPLQPFDYALQLSKNGNSGFLSRVYMMKIGSSPVRGYRYIARTLAPGRYRLDSMWQQGRWSVCLEKGTFEFTIAPGRIAFLGTLDAEQVLESLQAQAQFKGEETQAGGSYFQSHDATPAPVVQGRADEDLDAARQANMNRSGALVELAELDDAAFGTSSLGKAIKICG
ncbi:hypothetical protein [Sphingosinicella sp. BN140058]|uniref:hypothetical protein n=1 Tax=Sphingosinicella sp. BN140058 TaxID=1892855 RepID=UPI001010C76F|nr:hypothetical protein [Sphingosinicella sp. BN140058]QAY78489.1 hypothetical protein ETR14_19535 [Sphingosinicella sp. BN140058]